MSKNVDMTKAWQQLEIDVSLLFGQSVWDDYFKNNNTAKIIASIPFVSELDHPDRVAYASLVLLYAGQRAPHIAGHRGKEKLAERLHLLPIFGNGPTLGSDTDRLHIGRKLVELRLLRDYKQDQEDDAKSGKFNPVTAGAIDHDKVAGGIMKELESDQDAVGDYTVAVASIGGSLTAVSASTRAYWS